MHHRAPGLTGFAHYIWHDLVIPDWVETALEGLIIAAGWCLLFGLAALAGEIIKSLKPQIEHSPPPPTWNVVAVGPQAASFCFLGATVALDFSQEDEIGQMVFAALATVEREAARLTFSDLNVFRQIKHVFASTPAEPGNWMARAHCWKGRVEFNRTLFNKRYSGQLKPLYRNNMVNTMAHEAKHLDDCANGRPTTEDSANAFAAAITAKLQ